jgi:hypothetical protein
MRATAVSKIIRRACAAKVKLKIMRDLLGRRLLNRVSRRCPAIILAASRTERVIGRIMFLISSIITMKGINGAGVPKGTR